jgi:hypothetical protein
LRACALKDNQSWDKCLPYAEFSYNNSYQKSAGLLCFGMNLARIKSLDQTFFGKQKDKFRWSERT